MQVSKIHLSSAEMDLVTNQDIILTKNIILKKMRYLLEKVQARQINFVQENLLDNHEPFATGPKISRGENYLGLPYIVLDYPRMAKKENFLFIRTMFWWGNFFSSTLQAGGINTRLVLDGMEKNINGLMNKYFIGVNPDPWHHHFEESNYILINSSRQITNSKAQNAEFVKLSGKWPLTEWQNADTRLFDSWIFLLKISGLIS